MELLVVCDTLKQASNLFNRYINLVTGGPIVIRASKTRREIKFLDGLFIRFTSKKRYETMERFGFRGSQLDGNSIEKLLDIIEKSLED